MKKLIFLIVLLAGVVCSSQEVIKGGIKKTVFTVSNYESRPSGDQKPEVKKVQKVTQQQTGLKKIMVTQASKETSPKPEGKKAIVKNEVYAQGGIKKITTSSTNYNSYSTVTKLTNLNTLKKVGNDKFKNEIQHDSLKNHAQVTK